MRLRAREYLSPVASLGSPGIDELRWLRPVRPGDELSLCTTEEETRVSRSKPDRGLVHTRVELVDADRAAVLRLLAMNLVRTRPAQR